jgi:hypothetical protein
MGIVALWLGCAALAAQAQNCTAPTNIQVSSPSPGTAVVSFTPAPSATSYTVRYFWTGDSTATGTISVNTTSSPVTLSGLRPGGYYVVRVISNCAAGGAVTTAWSPLHTRCSITRWATVRVR